MEKYSQSLNISFPNKKKKRQKQQIFPQTTKDGSQISHLFKNHYQLYY